MQCWANSLKTKRFFLSSTVLLCLISFFAYGQNESEPDLNNPSSSPEAVAAQPLTLSIRYGKGGAIRAFRLNNGDSIFVSSAKLSSSTQEANAQGGKETEVDRQLGVLSDQIAQKITAIQKKQREIDEELFPAERPPLDVERRALERDLRLLEEKRNQLQSQKTAKDARQSALPVPPSPKVETGFTLKANLNGKVITLIIKPQSSGTLTSIQSSIDQWVQIFSAEQDQEVDIWAKVSLNS